MRANDINLSAFNYAKSTFDTFCELCSPLSELNIQGFAYLRVFNNGRYLYLCNDLNWLEFSLKNNGHFGQDTLLQRELMQARDSQTNLHCFLWPTEQTDHLMSALYAFNIWNGLSIYKPREDSIEIWSFAADREAKDMQSYFIQNIENLKKFSTYFSSAGSDIIHPTWNSLAPITNSIHQEFSIDRYSLDIDAFIKATDFNKFPVITEQGEIFLSKKELVCLSHLAVGKSAKKIGLDLGVSQRTIEKQIEHIRQKFGRIDKALIIKLFRESMMNWL